MSSAPRSAPLPTEIALVGTLALTVGAVLAFVFGNPAQRIEPAHAGLFLWLFAGLFLLRVAGQVVVLVHTPPWLPPMGQWNLAPYRLLLPVQIALVGVMTSICLELSRGSGVLAEPRPGLGSALVLLSYVYAGSMLVRFVIRMGRRPAERWFGGAIPIVFHVVLAAFVFTFATYDASY